MVVIFWARPHPPFCTMPVQPSSNIYNLNCSKRIFCSLGVYFCFFFRCFFSFFFVFLFFLFFCFFLWLNKNVPVNKKVKNLGIYKTPYETSSRLKLLNRYKIVQTNITWHELISYNVYEYTYTSHLHWNPCRMSIISPHLDVSEEKATAWHAIARHVAPRELKSFQGSWSWDFMEFLMGFYRIWWDWSWDLVAFS